MGLNFNEVFDNMISVVKTNLVSGGQEMMKFGQSIFENQKSKIESLSIMLIDGDINQDGFNLRMEDVKTTIEDQLLAEQAIAKSTAQKAINGALDVLNGAILEILKPPI